MGSCKAHFRKLAFMIHKSVNVKVGDLREPLTDEQIMAGRTWDVQLALALLDATAGTGLGGKRDCLISPCSFGIVPFQESCQIRFNLMVVSMTFIVT
jgi:hypothetical protein